ncbi:hypothetical protein AB6A40_008380 [Gnathostoma spinigerum]|uniref:Uncharacterized protein n=1 Tax=Gnathostoma spinigerum TaxID=75299 RepID=A0ABD6EW06_9BILA
MKQSRKHDDNRWNQIHCIKYIMTSLTKLNGVFSPLLGILGILTYKKKHAIPQYQEYFATAHNAENDEAEQLYKIQDVELSARQRFAIAQEDFRGIFGSSLGNDEGLFVKFRIE